MKRTLMVHWKDFTEGFFVRESEEVIFRALEGEGKLCYSGDMFDNWIYFSPVEMKGKDWYTRSKDIRENTDVKIQSEIHHLSMAFKAAQLEELPESANRQDERMEMGHSGIEADNLKIHPSPMAYLYWEARAQGFHNLRGKLFAEAFLRFLFTGIENVNISYSTAGYDSHLDRWGYIQDGPTERMSGNLNSSDHHRNPSDTSAISKDKYRMMLKNLNYIAFDLKAASQKVTSDVFVSIGNNLVLIAEVANISDIEYKKVLQLHTKMLLSLDKHKTLFGLLVQGHQVYLAEYTFEQAGGYKRQFSQKAFKYQKEDLKLLYSYLRTHFVSK
ncbi:uncharacterized protein LOC125674762 isoform X2 [Ostrea edulis]|nr:uncharacterized protein LOC125674762 isoform X2 [Ostrea edulis]